MARTDVGEHVEFPGNGAAAGGYLATPDHGGAGPALIVLGPSIGLDPHATGMCDRFASEGFTALAPEIVADASHGDVVVGLNLPVTVELLGSAIAFLEDHPMVHGKGVGLAGYEAGARLALAVAARASDEVKACALFDGPVLDEGASMDWAGIASPVEVHLGAGDSDTTRAQADALLAAAKELKLSVEAFTYHGAPPGFFDETRPELYDADAAREAFVRTLSFLRAHLG